jgi:hypothetical protein
LCLHEDKCLKTGYDHFHQFTSNSLFTIILPLDTILSMQEKRNKIT